MGKKCLLLKMFPPHCSTFSTAPVPFTQGLLFLYRLIQQFAANLSGSRENIRHNDSFSPLFFHLVLFVRITSCLALNELRCSCTCKPAVFLRSAVPEPKDTLRILKGSPAEGEGGSGIQGLGRGQIETWERHWGNSVLMWVERKKSKHRQWPGWHKITQESNVKCKNKQT